MDKDLVLRIRELNQNALRYLETVDYYDDEVCGDYTYQFCGGVLKVADRMNERRKASYLEKILKRIAKVGGKPLYDADPCDTGIVCDDRGCEVAWIIRPMAKFLDGPSEDPFNTDVTTVTVYITTDPDYAKWARKQHWLSNTNAKSRGHFPF
ncbi:hypothetical protein [Pontibacterium sp.]|uniref:hypothetical protein n=1 Tax=Pontibacterium sp. TaxID=2036026 RepID=UPI0035125951